jgi:hypothetical protein
VSIETEPKFIIVALRKALPEGQYSAATDNLVASAYHILVARDHGVGRVEFVWANGTRGPSLRVPDGFEEVRIYAAAGLGQETRGSLIGILQLGLQRRVVWDPPNAPIYAPHPLSATDGDFQVRVL